jgi:chemotaxis methyl-accepting protein methylase
MAHYKIPENLIFTDYYNRLQEQANQLRRDIIQQLEISESTFYNRLQDQKFTNPEKLVIAQLIEQPMDTLFPE